MDTTKTQDPQEIELKIFLREEKVFSGPVKDLPSLDTENNTDHRVEILGSEGSEIVSMSYRDFKKTVLEDV